MGVVKTKSTRAAKKPAPPRANRAKAPTVRHPKKPSTTPLGGSGGRTKAAAVVTPSASPTREPAVIVVGDHPAAALCALLLKEADVAVALLDIGTTPNADRLITLNPSFFDLHGSLQRLRSALPLAPITQIRFLGPDGESASATHPDAGENPHSQVMAFIASMREVREAMRSAAVDAGVPHLRASLLTEHIDDRGVHVRIGQERFVPAVLAVADPLPDEAGQLLDAPRFPGRGSSIQATARLRGGSLFGSAADPQVLDLTLDLGHQLNWGWLLRRGVEAQLCVQCPPEGDVPALMDEWTGMLKRHGVLTTEAEPDLSKLKVYDLPLGGALMRDVVARRTLLLGPAGGFYSASGEDVYPGCWSALFAAEVGARAVKAQHPQDALAAYRGRWGSTLGDYLRGPQQNLRFLLPLVYKNPVMTQRLAEAILLGQSLVK